MIGTQQTNHKPIKNTDKQLIARWQKVNGKLVCQWITTEKIKN